MLRRGLNHGFVATLLFVLFAGEAIRNTISWWGFMAIAGVLAVISVVVVVRHRSDLLLAIRRREVRVALVGLAAYLVWSTASEAWSFYPTATPLGLLILFATTTGAAAIVVTVSWQQFLRLFTATLGSILALSLLFELVVAVVIRRPILPVFPIIPDNVPQGGPYPDSFYWSRDLLFEGGRIQGILGNANLLGFVALLALVASVSLLVRPGRDRRLAGGVVVLAVATLALTRSTTVTLTAMAVLVVALVAVLARWPFAGPPRRALRAWLGAVLAFVLVAGGAAAALSSEKVLAALGKSPDLTGRLDIWSAVVRLIEQRPVVGWGWISYWHPWVAPFQNLAERRGVIYLQAHNAFLDVTLQLGVIGLVIFLFFIAAVVVRATRATKRGGASALVALLILTALLVQALAESRLLVEGNWAVLVLLAVMSLGRPAPHTVPPGGVAPRR
jgi:exopolysaccharide production protein ExoQ